MRALAALLVAACASAPPPRPGGGDAAFAAQVVAVDPPGTRDAPFAVAVVQFTNATDRPIVVRRYTLTWASGQASSDLEPIVVPPGASVQRRLDTHAYDAASTALGKVVVETPTAARASAVE